jgi:hypothetical protein
MVGGGGEEAGSGRGFWKVAKPVTIGEKKDIVRNKPCFGPDFFSFTNNSSLPRPPLIGPLTLFFVASPQQHLFLCDHFAPS